MNNNPLKIPEIVAYIIKYIPSEDLGPHLLEVNMIWKAETMRELKVRYKEAEDAYDKVEKEWEKTHSDLGQVLGDFSRKCDHEWKAYHKACDKRLNARIMRTEVSKALKRCGFKEKYDMVQDKSIYTI